MNGRLAVRSACSRVPSSRIDAQFISFLASCSTVRLPTHHAQGSHASEARGPAHLDIRGVPGGGRGYRGVQARGRESMP